MVVVHSKVVEAEATRAASYFQDAQSARGTGQSGSILKERLILVWQYALADGQAEAEKDWNWLELLGYGPWNLA